MTPKAKLDFLSWFHLGVAFACTMLALATIMMILFDPRHATWSVIAVAVILIALSCVNLILAKGAMKELERL